MAELTIELVAQFAFIVGVFTIGLYLLLGKIDRK